MEQAYKLHLGFLSATVNLLFTVMTEVGSVLHSKGEHNVSRPVPLAQLLASRPPLHRCHWAAASQL